MITPSSQIVSGQLLNGGLTNLTSFNLNWKVGSAPVNTMSVSSVNVTPSTFYSFTHTINWNPSANGTYFMKIWASNLNGANDMYHANDTLTQTIFVNSFPRKPLVEEFTQASCPPCAEYNPGLDAIAQPNITSGKISSVKYHTVWPGVDPMNVYNQAEVAQRVLYYGVGGVPSALVDGVFIPDNCGAYPGSAACFAQQNIDSALLIPSIFDIKISEAKTATVFNATVTLTAKTDIPFTSFSLYTVIMEDTIVYTSAPGTNGETFFPQVARKMLPDSTGYQLSPMTNNQILTYTYSYAPNTTICNISELHMVAFVSDDATRHVYQSENTSFGVTTGIHNINQGLGIIVYPNPNNGRFTIKLNEYENTTIEVYNNIAQRVLNQVLQANLTQLSLADFSNGIYQARVLKGGNLVYKTKIVKQE